MPTGVVSQRSGPPVPVWRRYGVSRERRSQSVSSRSTGSPRAAGAEHPAGQVLQHHRAAGQLGGRLDQPRRRRASQAELGEGLVHLAGEAHLLELLGDDRPVHALGDLDEADRAVERDHRQPGGAGAAQRRLRDRAVRRAQLDDQAGRAHLGELADELLGDLRRGRHPEAGGQHQLVTDEHRPDVAHLGDVHPADVGVQAAPRRSARPGRRRRGPAARALRARRQARHRL